MFFRSRIVDDGAALLRRLGRIGLGRAGTGGEQRHVPSGEVEMLDVPDRQFLAALAEIDAVAGGPGGRHRGHLVRRKLALRQDVRSEEHTSELQSLMRISYAVFCLKKKKQ